MRQLLSESLLLALAGGALGWLVAWWSVDLLVALAPPQLPRLEEIRLDGSVLLFALLVALWTGVLFGLAPAFQASRVDIHEALKDGAARVKLGFGLRHLRSVLVVTEVALALVLLIGAGLLLKSFLRLHEVAPGFSPERVLTVAFALPKRKYPTAAEQRAFYQQAIARLQAVPGAQFAGAINFLSAKRRPSARCFPSRACPPSRKAQIGFLWPWSSARTTSGRWAFRCCKAASSRNGTRRARCRS
jgi:putative ABC transport system permease protein